MEMLYGCPFEKFTFLPGIDTNSGFERDWDWGLFKDIQHQIQKIGLGKKFWSVNKVLKKICRLGTKLKVF